MYPEDMIAPMRAELANSGYTETKTPEEVVSSMRDQMQLFQQRKW